ncbi:MAG: NADH-quinone oxidoreductase subunit N [Deltaproteobacteria bacterium]|nr:NADH-quinone oxidoreductase subunit N [Deltaproteobacteria bacterium]
MVETSLKLMPLLALAGGSFLVLLYEVFSKKLKSYSFFLSLLILGISGYYIITLFGSGEITLFEGFLTLNNYWLFVAGLIVFVSFFTLLLSYPYKGLKNEYYFLILIAALGMSLIPATWNFLTLFLGVELLSLCFYILVTYQTSNLRANEAALKYFILGAFAAGFFVFGIALIYAATGSFSMKDTSSILLTPEVNMTYLTIGIAFIIVALGFKIASAPFHMWTPDAYEGAPTPITSFMATGVKVAAFAALYQIFFVYLAPLKTHWEFVFYALCILTMFVGNLGALIQKNVKRLLAYSSIAHAGYLLIPFVSYTFNTKIEASTSLFYYLVIYCIMNIGAFAIVIALGQEDIDDYAGLSSKKPLTALVFSLFLLSLAGFPPTAGFLAKFFIFAAALQTKFYWLVVLAVINAFIAIYYYTKIIVTMYMKESEVSETKTSFHPLLIVTLVIMAALTLYLGIKPDLLLNLIKNSLFF